MNQLSRREREKLQREQEITAAAERVFFRKGYYDASMDEIAREAEFAKGTIYQYFTGKEDLYFSATLKGVKRLNELMTEAAANGQTGLDMLRQIGDAYFRFSEEYPDTFRLMNYSQYIKVSPDSSPNYTENTRYGTLIFQTLRGVIEKGKTDGSIRAELDTDKTVFSFFLLISGFMSRLSEVGSAYAELFKVSREEIARFTLDLINSIAQAET